MAVAVPAEARRSKRSTRVSSVSSRVPNAVSAAWSDAICEFWVVSTPWIAVKAAVFAALRPDEAIAEVEIALSLDPQSYEVNLGAGYLYFREQEFAKAIKRYEIAAAAMPSDYHSAGTLLSCMLATGDKEGTLLTARMTLSRAEMALAQDQNNGSAIGFAVVALAVLGETARAREWIDRALLLDPENMNMRYNFACALCLHSNDNEAAMALMEPVLASTTATWLNHIKLDPDLALLRELPRFQGMLEMAERGLGLEGV